MTSALDSVPGGVLALTEDMRILAANEGMGALVGRRAAELVGESVDVLLSAPSRILFQTHVYPALRTDGHVEEVFLTFTEADGSAVPVLFNARRAAQGDGRRYEALVVQIRARLRWETDLLDATRALERERAASHELAQQLAKTADDLAARFAEEQRSRAFRDAFIGVISHELRTPLTTIFGMAHVVRRGLRSMDPSSVEEHLADIEAEADRLRRLTEDLLVLSRAEGGRLVVARDPLLVGHVARRAVRSEQARAKDHELVVEAPAPLPLVLGEELYVEQVIRNYLSNATKYSPPGTTVRVVAESEGGGVAVRVQDEGPGLGDQDPAQLFELFYRAPGAIGQSSGAGIGLFVCRELIGAMAGRVWAAAAPGGGAEFGFWLPATTTAAAAGARPPVTAAGDAPKTT